MQGLRYSQALQVDHPHSPVTSSLVLPPTRYDGNMLSNKRHSFLLYSLLTER